MKYNQEHGITPQSVRKEVRDILEISTHSVDKDGNPIKKMSKKDRLELIAKLKNEMRAAAKLLEFEHAAYLRDKIKKLRGEK